MIYGIFRVLVMWTLLVGMVVGAQIVFFACSGNRHKRDFAKAEQACFQMNVGFIKAGDCARCYVNPNTNQEYVSYDDCKMPKLSVEGKAR